MPNNDDTRLPFEASAGSKVLVVDDDEFVGEKLAQVLSEAGFQVRIEQNPSRALDVLQEDFAPIVIVDRLMPGVDGIELCRAIRAQRFPGYVYLILLTVKDSEEDILTGLAAGADDYLSKRASDAQLIARLRTAQRILRLEGDLRQATDEARLLAETDPLTGTRNRRYFDSRMLSELKRGDRFGRTSAILLLDVDHFKAVNDTYGHAVGDEVLKELVRRIATLPLRAYDWHARIGGEEFVVVLPECRMDGALAVAERLRLCVAGAPFQTAAGPVGVTISLGVAVTDPLSKEDTATANDLLMKADECLYRSKANGRNRVTGALNAPLTLETDVCSEA